MTTSKKSIIGGGLALLAAMGGWFYKVATMQPSTEPVTTEEIVPGAKPEPELSWYDWAKSYIPDIKIDPPSNKTQDTPNDIIQNQLKGP